MSNETDSFVHRVDTGSYLGFVCFNGYRTLVAVSSDSVRLCAYCVSFASRFCPKSSGFSVIITQRCNIGTPSVDIFCHSF